MSKMFITFAVFIFVGVISCCAMAEKLAKKVNIAWLSSLDLSKMSSGWGNPVANKSIQSKELSLRGHKFTRGVGTHAKSILYINLYGQAQRFHAIAGIDDETNGKGSIKFRVYTDSGKKLYDSGLITGKDDPVTIDLNLNGLKTIILVVTSAGDGQDFDHADWADAYFEYKDKAPVTINAPVEEKIILTPKPGPKPIINGTRVYGARPGNPFLYRICATGSRPMVFSVENLPSSLKLDPIKGIISGNTPSGTGEYNLVLKASNKYGKSQAPLKIIVGDTLALTPPMGWNSWYIHYHRVSDADMRAAADAMISSGMADFGYAYVNIDDCWMEKPTPATAQKRASQRSAHKAIGSNSKFPDMKALTAYIHSKGLKAGIYTSPGPFTCAGYMGSYQYEKADAQQFADWGFDFLKYDWCSYGRIAKNRSLPELMKPYAKMGNILKNLNRDIVFNLCQYGMGKVWQWADQVEGNCWRTTGDLGLSTLSEGIYRIGLSNASHYAWAKPGHWNDPDYILIGYVGNARKQGIGKPTTLTPNEQYTQMSMWCLMASPLIFSGDMTKLDDFTLNVLCNAEVIAVDQDPLGKQGKIIDQNEDYFIMVKEMSDGSLAAGLFNTSVVKNNITLKFSDIGIHSQMSVRDLWRQKELGIFTDNFTVTVPRHGVVMIRLRKKE